ncbi:MAG: hypothetical protein ABT940_12045 [Alphaproteobacteria bacterium]
MKLREIEAGQDMATPVLDRAILQCHKWGLIHKIIREHPFRVPETLPRSEQWRRVREYLSSALGEPELVAWLGDQIEIASNLERGIQDLRPRSNAPCHTVVLRYTAGRERKANAVHEWALAAVEGGWQWGRGIG